VSAAAPTPIAVLISGRGSNLVALQAAIEAGQLPARIALVVSDVAGAEGLVRARALGLEAIAIERRSAPTRAAHEALVIEALRASGAEWICLAGYMRLLSAQFVAAFRNRILNIHPSLLPSFPGLHPQRQALEAGVRISGCTVHLVDEGLDSGPIVAQIAVELLEGDDEVRLAERILRAEHRLYADSLRRLLCEPWSLEGKRLRFEGPKPPGDRGL
jgi:phosphoribosylglycinamide formyltransferase-1